MPFAQLMAVLPLRDVACSLRVPSNSNGLKCNKDENEMCIRDREQAQVITSLTLQNEWLLEQLKLSKKKLFGRSSEQAEQMVMDLSLIHI